MFTATDWTTVISVAAGSLVTIASLWKKLEQKDPQLVKEIPHKVVEVVDDVASFFENIAKSPFFAGKVAAGELKAKHVLDELTQTKAVSEAKTILMQLGKAYSALSVEEQIKSQSVLKLGLLKLGINMTDAEIQAVFQAVDAAGQALSADKTFATLFEQPAQPQA